MRRGSTTGAAVTATAIALALGVLAGCNGETYEPGAFQTDHRGDAGEQRDGNTGPGPSATADSSATLPAPTSPAPTSPGGEPGSGSPAGTATATRADPVDVCARVPSDRVKELLGWKSVHEPQSDPDSQRESGEDQLPTISQCRYVGRATKKTQSVLISVMPRSGVSDARGTVDLLLGPESEPVDGVGQAAGLARAPRPGVGDKLATAQRTEAGMSGVLVVGPDGTRVRVLARLARDTLAGL